MSNRPDLQCVSLGFTQRHTWRTAHYLQSRVKHVDSVMADEYCDISEIVTAFLLNTCRRPPWPRMYDLQAAVVCAVTAGEHPDDDEEAEFIPLTTGSVAEFYIEPMLPYVGDIDMMFYWNTLLAIPQGHPPATQLPAEFHNYVEVFEIIDSHLPAYVYLLLRYRLTQCTENKNYNYSEFDEDEEIKLLLNTDNEVDENDVHGPALFHDNSHIPRLLSVDGVLCVRCLSWPPQAADWPTRHRNYGWPDSTTLGRVVCNGCDVVGVAHRQCRQDEWIGKRQWRLSFSRAEIVLINSWAQVQQITYHLLRVYIKTERLTESAHNSVSSTLSNYHIKTLMLWACELKSESWWRTENFNLVKICAELLNTLSVWLTDRRCRHYFINNCNLLDNSFNVGTVANKFMSLDKDCLSAWLVNNYIKPCAKLCPNNMLLLFDDVRCCAKLQNAVSEIVRWKRDTSLYHFWRVVDFAEYNILHKVSACSLTVRSCVCWMEELAKIDKRFFVYFSAVALLHVARKVSRNCLSDKLKDILLTILQNDFSCCYSVFSLCNNKRSAPELVELLHKSAVERLTTYRQLVAQDVGSIGTIVTTDFEALYAYKRGDYQQCLQLSTQNVRTLLYAGRYIAEVPTFPEFIQLMDDDIVSLTALTLIVSPKCRTHSNDTCILQVTLSLYLMTRCQLKLHHSVTSLVQTLFYIDDAERRHSRRRTLDQLTLKLIEHKVYLAMLTRWGP